MSDDLKQRADQMLEQALTASGARDPRDFYRDRLRELKKANADGYEQAVHYYRGTLIPTVAGGEQDALEAWTEYGRRLADALAPGRTVSIDETGRAHPFNAPQPGRLLLHLPEDKGSRALLAGLPLELTTAQRATYDVLISGKQRFPK